jgi:hypothetical protein
MDDTDTVTSRLFRKSFNCRYNPRMDYAFCLLTVVYLSFDIYKITMTSWQTFYCTNEKGKCEKNCFLCNYRSGLPLSTHRPVTTKNKARGKKQQKNMWSRLFRKSFNCRYNPRMDYAFCLLTLKSSEKWRSPLFGATCNFNDQILPYGILFFVYQFWHTINWYYFKSFTVSIALLNFWSAISVFNVHFLSIWDRTPCEGSWGF